jgi:hypothetical protein
MRRSLLHEFVGWRETFSGCFEPNPPRTNMKPEFHLYNTQILFKLSEMIPYPPFPLPFWEGALEKIAWNQILDDHQKMMFPLS